MMMILVHSLFSMVICRICSRQVDAVRAECGKLHGSIKQQQAMSYVTGVTTCHKANLARHAQTGPHQAAVRAENEAYDYLEVTSPPPTPGGPTPGGSATVRRPTSGGSATVRRPTSGDSATVRRQAQASLHTATQRPKNM